MDPPSCSEESEIIIHCLVVCSFARAMWERVGIGTHLAGQENFGQWLLRSLREVDKKVWRIIRMICLAIWKARNQLVRNQKGMDVSTVVFHAHDLLNQWSSAHDKKFNSSMAWLKPGDGVSTGLNHRYKPLKLMWMQHYSTLQKCSALGVRLGTMMVTA